jgi:hypothetical protein
MLPAKRIQKRSTTISVQIGDGQEVFRQHADRRIVNPVYGMSLHETFPLRIPSARLYIPIKRKLHQRAIAAGPFSLSDKQALD